MRPLIRARAAVAASSGLEDEQVQRVPLLRDRPVRPDDPRRLLDPRHDVLKRSLALFDPIGCNHLPNHDGVHHALPSRRLRPSSPRPSTGLAAVP